MTNNNKIKDMELKFKDLPVEIQERMLEHQVEQGNNREPNVFEDDINSNSVEGGFDWDQTIEGRVFWVDVISFKKLDIFFKKYPKDSNKRIHADLIIAWANGATIEYFTASGKWEIASAPAWGKSMVYRIKPEEESPGYIPYDTEEELLSLLGTQVKRKTSVRYGLITSVYFKDGFSKVILEGTSRTTEQLLGDYQRLDGSPLGKLG